MTYVAYIYYCKISSSFSKWKPSMKYTIKSFKVYKSIWENTAYNLY